MKYRKPTYSFVRLATAVAFFSLLLALPNDTYSQTKRHNNKEKQEQKAKRTYIVDDESCGCELFFVDGIQTIRHNERFGFKLEDGTVIVEPKYMFVDKFTDGYCIVYTDYEHCGLIDRTGREIVPTTYRNVYYPSDGMVLVMQDNNTFGFYDTSGRMVIEPCYFSASSFNEGKAVALLETDSGEYKYGYIDKSGKTVIQPAYDYAYAFSEGYATVVKNELNGMIDSTGREVMPCTYLEISVVSDGRFFVADKNSHKVAMYSTKIKPVTGFVYDKILNHSEGYYTFQRNGKEGYLNKKGKECFGMHDHAYSFHNGFACVGENGHFGIINNKGKFILPAEYDNSDIYQDQYIFHEGLALVEKKGRYGFVNTKGEIVIPLIYEGARHCTEGLIPAKRGNMWGYIDKEGNDAIEFVFDQASTFEWGRAEVVYHDKTHKINPYGECVKDCKTFPKIWHK